MPEKPTPTPVTSPLNREAWLTEVARGVVGILEGYRKPFPSYRVTCGWPCKNGLGISPRVGECHYPRASADGVHEIFVSPLLDEPLVVAGTLSHELVHVVSGYEARHGRDFLRVCGWLGLTKGKPQSIMPGDRLNERLRRIVERVGVYPHKALVGIVKPARPPVLVKLVCPCGLSGVFSIKKLAAVGGCPTCYCGQKMRVEVADD